MSGLHFAVFSLCAVFGNMLWQYVNSMKCMTFGGPPNMHSMSSLSLAKHVHGVVGHVQWSSDGGTVLSCGQEFWLPTFIRV